MSGGRADTNCEIRRPSGTQQGLGPNSIAHDNIICLDRRLKDLRAEARALERRIEEIEQFQDAVAETIRDETAAEPERIRRPQSAPVTFLLTSASRRRPESLALDPEIIARFCADADGCLLTLGLHGVVEGRSRFEAVLSHGPCSFHIDAETGAWALDPGCADPGSGADRLGPRGRDGDGATFSDRDRGAEILLGIMGACLLTEGRPARRVTVSGPPGLEMDTTRGLHLLAATPDWDPQRRFPEALLPPGAPFDCRLTLRD